MTVDVQALDCDFYVFSGHKLYGPAGIGVLYGKQALLEAMPPYQGGGDMIRKVAFEETEYNVLPYKFEAGTPSIADVVGLGAAIDYLNAIGMDNIAAYEAELLAYAAEKARQIKGLRIIGEAEHKGAILSFVLDKIHPHDIGTMLDSLGIAIRAGHHCAMPVMDFFKVPATARASFAMYNTKAEIDVLMKGIESLIEVFGVIYTIKAYIHTGEESGFIAECVELPVVTQGQTLDEVVLNLREAISLHLDGEDLAALGFALNHRLWSITKWQRCAKIKALNRQAGVSYIGAIRICYCFPARQPYKTNAYGAEPKTTINHSKSCKIGHGNL